MLAPDSDTDHLTIFCDLPKLNKFGLVTGFNSDWHGKTEEELKNDENLFTVHYLDDIELANGSLVFEPNEFTGIAYNDFEPVTQDLIKNFNFKPVYSVGLLCSPDVSKKILLIMAQHCVKLRKNQKILRNDKRDLKKEINVCITYSIIINIEKYKQTNIKKIKQI